MKDKTRTIQIETPDNRKILYYLKGKAFDGVAKIISIDEVEDKKYEALVECKGDGLDKVFNQENKLDLKTSLNYLIQMADCLRVLHAADEPVAINNLQLNDFVLTEEGIKLNAFEKLIWAEPEYVAENIKSFLDIVRNIISCINFSGERNINHLKEMPDLRFRTMDLVKLELQRIYKSCFKPYNPNMPIGFRSGVVKNNVAALFVYFVALNIALRQDFSKYTSINNGVCQAILFIIMIITIFFAGNYKNVLDVFKINKIKNKYLKYIVIGLLSIIVFVLLMFVFINIIKLLG